MALGPYGRPHKYCNGFIRDSIGNIWKSGIPKGMSSLLKWCRILANNRPGNSQNIHIQQRKQRRGLRPRPTGARSAPVDAFFVKSDYSVPGDVHSAYNYTHFVFVWQHFANYFDNSYRSYIPYVLLNYVRHLYHFPHDVLQFLYCFLRCPLNKNLD